MSDKDSRYSFAPYNFVSFPEKENYKYNSHSELPKHDKIDKKLLSGNIKINITAKSPIMISIGVNNEHRFFKNMSDKFTIPGSSFRGLIRSNAMILSGSIPVNDIQDDKFLYRDIAGVGSSKNDYLKIVQAGRIKTGYLYNDNGSYIIKESQNMKSNKNKKNYLVIDDIYLREIYTGKAVNFMYNKTILKDKNEIRRLNKTKKFANIQKANRLKSKHMNPAYKPYFSKISFNFDWSKNKITKIVDFNDFSKEKLKYNGFIMSSNMINGKMQHYIIVEPERKINNIKLSKSDIENYNGDLIRTKKADIKDGKLVINSGYEYYNLPKNKDYKPVFYLIKGNDIFFGFTQYLRIPYKNSVLSNLQKKRDKNRVNYVDGLFGFTTNNNHYNMEMSYKSRLSFSDLISDNGEIDNSTGKNIRLMEPKPTSYQLYLKQTEINPKKLDNYNDNFELAGFKEYWLKDYIDDSIIDKDNNKIDRRIYPLKKGTIFTGDIKFFNLDESELGLLLRSLIIKENAYQNIGLGKSLGYGRIKVDVEKLYIVDFEKKYKKDESNIEIKYNNYVDDKTSRINEYINSYNNEIKDKLDSKTIENFEYMKTQVISEDYIKEFKYMDIKNNGREIKFSDKKPLKTISMIQSELEKHKEI